MTLKPRALVRYGPAPSGMAVTDVERTISVVCRAITVRFEGSEHAIRRERAQLGHDRWWPPATSWPVTGLPSRQCANDSLKADSIFGPSVPVVRVGCYPVGGVQLAAAESQLPLTGPFRTGFKSAQAKESASSNVGVGPGTSAADCG